ncbi:MAG: tRNA 2-thiouridine(34) synthase MnmA [Candidatus Aminicenantes bacterium]|nr:tRNA 2-thiouridine(34) synthase MnmA [Acidobacteriota bacterium]MCG2810226.1 tRNA 2-thiouridine(34) synthase MnmA [Candidatus Aminicenantes bacterium]
MSRNDVPDNFPRLKKNSNILVALSGGVDSAVAAALLQQWGCRVTGIIMKIWDGDYLPGRAAEKCRPACFGPEEERDVEDAREVCRQLGIPFLTVDLREEYRRLILDYSRREYGLGRTPNPCVRCNRLLKFKAILDLAVAGGVVFDFFATGHYVRSEHDRQEGLFRLIKARDRSKDQSYFLYSLTQKQLASCVFPLGDLQKTEVRAIARSLKLLVAEKEESQDFVAGGLPWLLQGQGEPGPIIDEKGHTLGRHSGIAYFTIGQRHGLGLTSAEPLYVTRLDRAGNAVQVGKREALFSDHLEASAVHWIVLPGPLPGASLKARIRYHHAEAEARVFPRPNGRMRVEFAEAQLAITPGQSVVFYQNDEVLGGGTIDE